MSPQQQPTLVRFFNKYIKSHRTMLAYIIQSRAKRRGGGGLYIISMRSNQGPKNNGMTTWLVNGTVRTYLASRPRSICTNADHVPAGHRCCCALAIITCTVGSRACSGSRPPSRWVCPSPHPFGASCRRGGLGPPSPACGSHAPF